MGIYIDTSKIGYVYSREEATPTGYRFTEKSTMRLIMLGMDQTFSSNLVVNTDSSLDLVDFTFDIASAQNSFYASGVREGDELTVTIETAGRTETQGFEVEGEVLTAPALGVWLWNHDPQPGDAWTVTIFEPTILRTIPVNIKVIAEEMIELEGEAVPALHIETRMLGIKTDGWFDSTGTSIKQLQQPGIVMVRESREEALAAETEVAKLDLLSFFAVKPDSAIPAPRAIKELKLKVRGLSQDADLVLSSTTQEAHWDGDEVILSITSPDTASAPRSSRPASSPAEFLSPSIYIQTDDAQIRETAASIVESESDAMTAASRLVNWVYANLEKRATASVPSAVEVLETRAGDCNEHAILLAALGRAAGIPTKINVGLVYLDGAFYYHAWNSFWIGERWVPADATFGQLPADPTHIQLHEGELDEQAKVLSVVGNIEISVISYR